MTVYALGLAMSDDNIVLIKKNRPDFQKDKFNFVGGHVEENEAPKDCMVREFAEETGVLTSKDMWKYLGKLERKDDFTVFIYFMKSDVINKVETMTDESIYLVDLNVFLTDKDFQQDLMSNLLTIYNYAISQDFVSLNSTMNIQYPSKDLKNE